MASILVIDDDPLALECMVLSLAGSGHDVDSAEDGDQGLKLLNDHVYDLIVTDLIMPNKEGIETILEIKRHYKNTKIIAVSGGGRLTPMSYLTVAKDLGADCILEKPFSSSELAQNVDYVLLN